MAGETRQKILEATEVLIQMKGLSRVTTREIARETGMSEGALYRHFERKEQVFFAILTKYLPPFLDTLQSHTAGTGTVSANLEAIALASIHYYGHLLPVAASFVSDKDLLAQYHKAFAQIEGGPHTFFEVVATYIEEEQQLGRIKKDVPAMNLAILLLGPCFQYEFLRQFTRGQPFGQTDHEFVSMLVQSLAPGNYPEQEHTR